MEQLDSKVAVVTGGASGIGLAMAKAFAAQGMKVVLADIEQAALDAAPAALPDGTEFELVVCDVGDAAAVDALRDAALDRFGAVHVVCNNAGVGSGGLAWEVPLADWDWVLGVDLMGVVHGVRSFAPLFIEQGEGHLVNTASMAGVTSPPFMAPYNVAKHGVVTLSETLYADLQMVGATNVGVTVLCPGWVQTQIHRSARNKPRSTSIADGSSGVVAAGEDGFADAVGQMISGGLDPADVADLVVKAVRGNEFYILTHEDWIVGITSRTERMVAGKHPIVMLPS